MATGDPFCIHGVPFGSPCIRCMAVANVLDIPQPPKGILKFSMSEDAAAENQPRQMRQFGTGATRDSADDKFDYEGFLSPEVLDMFASYMHKHRHQADGNLRDSDNWQKGIPKDAYMKSAFRHFMDWWRQHRGQPGQDELEESLSALMFNVMGYLFEVIREKKGDRTPQIADGSVRSD